MYDKIHSKLVQKKPTNDIVNFRYLSEVCDVCRTKCTLSWSKKRLQNKSKISYIYIESFRYICTRKYTLSWNKKRLQNKSEVSDLIGFFVPNYSDLSRDVKKKKIFFQTAPRTRRLEDYCLFCYTPRQIHCKLEQRSLQNKTEISYRLFCSNL